MRRAAAAGVWAAIAGLAFQPETAMLRRVYEENLARRQREFGAGDTRTAQAARDLGLFLSSAGDKAAARKALAEAVRIDDQALGKSAEQTLEDVAALAAISPAAEAAPLLRRAAESMDASIAGPALTSLAGMRKAAGDSAAAAALLRRALEKAEAVSGKDGPIVALILNELALAVPPEEGIALTERALKIGADGAAAGAIAGKLRVRGDNAGAERLYREALAADQQILGARHEMTRTHARSLAELLRATGRPQEAAALEQQFKAAPSR